MLVLRVPQPDEFRIRQGWLADPDMMSFNAGWNIAHPGYERTTGCIDWPVPEWPAFQARLALPASEQGYFYVQDSKTEEYLGHVHYELDQDLAAQIGLNMIPGRRGQGFGPSFLRLLLDHIWTQTQAREVVNEFETPASPPSRPTAEWASSTTRRQHRRSDAPPARGDSHAKRTSPG